MLLKVRISIPGHRILIEAYAFKGMDKQPRAPDTVEACAFKGTDIQVRQQILLVAFAFVGTDTQARPAYTARGYSLR